MEIRTELSVITDMLAISEAISTTPRCAWRSRRVISQNTDDRAPLTSGSYPSGVGSFLLPKHIVTRDIVPRDIIPRVIHNAEHRHMLHRWRESMTSVFMPRLTGCHCSPGSDIFEGGD